MMKKMNIAIIVFFLLAVICVVAQAGEPIVSMKVEIYSGRPNPEWNMSLEDMTALLDEINSLPESEPIEIPDYYRVVITNEEDSEELPFSEIYLFHDEFDRVILVDGEDIKYYEDNKGIVEKYMGSGEQISLYPPDTPHMDLIEESLGGTAVQGEVLEDKFSIYADAGTAPLEGRILAPKHVTVDKTNFSIPNTGVVYEWFTVSADTSRPRTIKGDIVILSNDPNNSELRIPVDFTITAKEGEPEQKPDSTAQTVMGVIIALVLTGAVLYFALKYMKKNKE